MIILSMFKLYYILDKHILVLTIKCQNLRYNADVGIQIGKRHTYILYEEKIYKAIELIIYINNIYNKEK